MKVIRIHAGTAAVRMPLDRPSQPVNPPVEAVLLGIQNRFQFASAPQSAAQSPPFIFQHGQISDGKSLHAINQLVVQPDGDVATASDTDVADMIINQLLEYLTDTFSSSFDRVEQTRTYASAIIVQFDKEFEKSVKFIGDIERVISGHMHRSFMKLSFGEEALIKSLQPGSPVTLTPLQAIESVEFAIERRGGHSFAENRFFCTAPLRTADHLAILEKLEVAMNEQTNPPATEKHLSEQSIGVPKKKKRLMPI